MIALQYAVFATAGLVAITVIVMMIAPQWRRIVSLAFGKPDLGFQPSGPDRWRRVHIDADRRKPFSKIRAASPRRGLLDRRSPH